MADSYLTQNVLVTWGHDFAFADAENTFGLINDIKGFLEKETNLTMQFSTVKEYIRAVSEEYEEQAT
jgi:hypothetical protein